MVSGDKIKPLHSLTKEEEKLNKDNEWFKSIKGESGLGIPAIKKFKSLNKNVSRSQRTAIINEKDSEPGNYLNSKQRKSSHGE